jgi:hypothetical protein
MGNDLPAIGAYGPPIHAFARIITAPSAIPVKTAVDAAARDTAAVATVRLIAS